MRKIIICMFFLLAVTACGADLSTTAKVGYRAYDMLGLDTGGVDGLDSAKMNNYVNLSMRELNSVFNCYKRIDTITTSGSSQYYALDSVVNLINVIWINGDSSVYLHLIPPDSAIKIYEVISTSEDDYPEYAYMWSDSLRLLPTPENAWTLLVEYSHVIPDDSIRLIPSKYRDGVLFYSAYMAGYDLLIPKYVNIGEIYKNFRITFGRPIAE